MEEISEEKPLPEKLKVYFFGYGGSSHLAEELRPLINSLEMDLVTIHEWENANVKWNLNTWRDELNKADIIIIPCDYKRFPAKSANKLTQVMTMGKPVVCSPLDAYKAIEEKYQGCCLFADNPEEWKEQLLRLRNSPDFRKELGQRGVTIAQDVRIDRIGEKWVNLLQTVKISTDIIIPTFNNLRGLKLCIESIRHCTPETHTVIVVNNGPDSQIHEYLEQQKDVIYIKKDRMTFAQAVNVGIKAGQGQYVMILNDDTIVSDGWLGGLLRACGEGIGAVGPLSNCDKGWLHNYDIKIGGVDLLPGLNTFEQIEPIIPSIYAFKSPYKEIVERDWVAFYCTLIPREVLNKTGYLCEEYTNSGEDVDLCKRIKLMGYKIIQNYESFIFHQGAVSRKGLEKTDYKKYHEDDNRTQAVLKRIWEKKTVVLYSGPSYERWDYRSIDKGGIGGSETWQIWLARELQKKGYRVISFCDCNGPVKDYENSPEYVEYRPYTEFPKYIDEHYIDYLILSRTVDPLDLPVRAGKVFVQIHDVFLLNIREKTHIDKVDKYCILSDWHRDFASDYHKIPKDKFLLMANGIDFKRFDKIQVTRNYHRLIWASSWDRGLDNVLYLWPFLKERVPDLELAVFYGTQTWKASCQQKNDTEGLKKIEELERGVRQPGITVYGRIPQNQLAIEYKKSGLLLYCTAFSETFFIGGLEANRAGCPVIANNYAGLRTTLKDGAILLGNGDAYYPYSKEGREAFFASAIELLTNREKWTEWSKKGFENSEKYSWTKTAEKWAEEFNKHD
jgi:GT2 family glycosyltransferase